MVQRFAVQEASPRRQGEITAALGAGAPLTPADCPGDAAPIPADPIWLSLPLEDLATNLAHARAAYAAAIASLDPIARDISAMETHLAAQLKSSGAVALAHPDLIVELEERSEYRKHFDVLAELRGKVPDAELRKALYITNPEPEHKADARALLALSRKYGGAVAEIVSRGLVKVPSGPVRVSIREREPDRIAGSIG